MPHANQLIFWKRLQTVLLLIVVSTSILWFSLFWSYVQTRPSTPQPRSGNLIPLHSHGVTVYITSEERFKLQLAFYPASILGLTMFLIHFWKEPYKRDRR
jgi:hypothetical protein